MDSRLRGNDTCLRGGPSFVNPTEPTAKFYRTASVCSLLSAVTTLVLIFVPRLYAPVEGFDGRMARVHDPAYRLRAWAYLIHPFLVSMAALGVAFRIRRFAPG